MSDLVCSYSGDRDDVLVAYLYDEIDPVVRASFDAHIATCERCREELADLSNPPSVYFGHSTRQLACQVPTRDVNVQECCGEAPVACERSDRVQLPTSTCQIRQAKMPQRVCNFRNYMS